MLCSRQRFDRSVDQSLENWPRLTPFVGISQRDSNYYDFLQPADELANVQEKMEDLFEDHITENFPLSSCQSSVLLGVALLTL